MKYRLKRFSNDSKESGKKERKDRRKKKSSRSKKAAIGVAAGLGATYGASELINKINRTLTSKVGAKSNEYADAESKLSGSSELKSKVINDIKSSGINIIEVPGLNNSTFALTSVEGNLLKDTERVHSKLVKRVRSEFKSKGAHLSHDQASSYVDAMLDGKDNIIVGIDSPSVIAHEKGHADNSKTTGGKLRLVSANLGSGTAKLVGSGVGFNSGLRSERLKSEGKKESKWQKHQSWIVPTLMHAPELVEEGMASMKGYKNIKNLGASKDQLAAAKKSLGTAFGTYAIDAAASAGLGLAARGAGKLAGKYIYGTKKSKKSDDDKEADSNKSDN